MPNNAEKDLFELIRSLTRSEKRYFKMRSVNTGGSKDLNYLQLFDLLECMEDHDAQALKQAVSRTSIKLTQLANLKKHLHRQLLKSLRDFHSCATADLQLKEMMEHFEIIYEKGLFSQCQTLLNNMKNMAQRHELFEKMPELTRWSRILIFKTGKSSRAIEASMEALQKEEIEYTRHWEQISFCEALAADIYALFAREGRVARYADTMTAFDQVIEDILNLEGDPDTSLRTRFSMYRALHIYYNQKALFNLSEQYAQKHVDLYEGRPELMQHHVYEYIKAMNGLIVSQNAGGKYEQALIHIERLRQLPENTGMKESEKLQTAIFDSTLFHEIEQCLWQGKVQHGLHLLQDAETRLPLVKSRINIVNLHSKCYRIALLYFIAGQYKKCGRWISKLKQDGETSFRNDIKGSLILLELLLQYDNKEHNYLLDHLLPSARRQLEKINRWGKLEAALCKGLEKAANAPGRETEVRELSSASYFIKEILKTDVHERHAMCYFNISCWFESRLTGIPLSEVLARTEHRHAALAE